MDFWQTVLLLFRRWYVVLPALLASLGAATMVYLSTPVYYVSHSVIVLATSPVGSSVSTDRSGPPALVNPLLNYDYGLSTSASIIIQSLNSPEMAAELGVVPQGESAYKVSNGSTNPELLVSGPFIFIDGESRDPAAARALVQKVAKRVARELAARQKDLEAPPQTYVTANVVVAPTVGESKGGSRGRAGAAAVGIGLIISVASGFASDSVATRWAQRRRDRNDLAKSGAASRRAEPVGAVRR